MNIYRQGDIALIETKPVRGEEVARDNGRIVLAYGEITGHAHAILDKSVRLVEWNGARYVSSPKPFTMQHEEHAAVVMPPGTFRIVRQREYTPQEIRRVMD